MAQYLATISPFCDIFLRHCDTSFPEYSGVVEINVLSPLRLAEANAPHIHGERAQKRQVDLMNRARVSWRNDCIEFTSRRDLYFILFLYFPFSF